MVPSARVPISIFGERATVTSASGGAKTRFVPVSGFVMVPVPVPVPMPAVGLVPMLVPFLRRGASANVRARASARASDGANAIAVSVPANCG